MPVLALFKALQVSGSVPQVKNDVVGFERERLATKADVLGWDNRAQFHAPQCLLVADELQI